MRDQLMIIPQLEKKLQEQEKRLSSGGDNIITLSRALRDIAKTYKDEVEDSATSLVLVISTFTCSIENFTDDKSQP